LEDVRVRRIGDMVLSDFGIDAISYQVGEGIEARSNVTIGLSRDTKLVGR
jgi:hypothetical protein